MNRKYSVEVVIEMSAENPMDALARVNEAIENAQKRGSLDSKPSVVRVRNVEEVKR